MTQTFAIRAFAPDRRLFLLAATALAACGPAAAADPYAAAPARKLTPAQWKAKLPPASFSVLRQEGTEAPFSSPLNDEHRRGTFVCLGCELPLFRSQWKFDSHTGWPSFYTAIDGALGKKTDLKIGYPRTEYHCARCLGHQGHVFDDGPQPTGLRYCNNGVALKFVPA
ncbi:MAG TPA: peptide-methionine (R)-S-oxide reductase MsrB [Caulobacteraceae bacterium]